MCGVLMDGGLRLDLNLLDYVILACYFLTVLGIGVLARRSINSRDRKSVV